MAELSCPSCGAPVPVRGAALPYVVCGHCRTLIARRGEGLEAMGTSAVLPFDVSPLQLGTTGTFLGGRAFEVVGRVRWGWTDGSWNEWLLRLPNSETAWLGEAMGWFTWLTEAPAALKTPLARRFAEGGVLALGDILTVDGSDYAVADIKTAHCLGGEGELPFPCPPGRTMDSVDLRGFSGAVMSLQRDADGASAWIGQMADLSDLAPRNLRALDGWAIPAEFAR